jgi:hypothetical protein
MNRGLSIVAWPPRILRARSHPRERTAIIGEVSRGYRHSEATPDNTIDAIAKTVIT